MLTATALTLLADGGSDASGVKVAVIGAVALVLSVAVPALLSRKERVPKEIAKLQRHDDEYRRRLEKEAQDADSRCEMAETRVRRLERFIWTLGYDPDTEQRVKHEEPQSG